MRLFINISIFFFLLTTNVLSDEAANWLKKEIDVILNAYTDTSMTNEARFLMIENTINYNFAGAGIAKFVSGDSWSNADKVTKKAYIKLFKRHLALNIASLLQGYSNQQYELSNSKYDSKSKVSLINMEIFGETGNLEVTWRVKQAKDRFFVIDLLVADISLVVTKRSEFNSMLKTVNNDLSQFNRLLDDQNKISFTKIIN
jgi:ABC-type transporter MlaC component